tara:strand:- start:662 stop:844 length:183 start_codon:yes stop_codon:yes gene_type:complete
MEKTAKIEEYFNLVADGIDKAGDNEKLFLSKLVLCLCNEVDNSKKIENYIGISLKDLNLD